MYRVTKQLLRIAVALLISLPVQPALTSALHAADLSYPPPGSSIRYVDKRNGESNRPQHVDRMDIPSTDTSHTIIQPGYKPYLSRQQATATSRPASRATTLDTGHNDYSVRRERPLLWKIDAPGGASNYIMGTIHLDDERILDLPDTVLSRLRSADRLMLELKLDQRTSLDIMRRMIFTDGRTLPQVIGDDLYTDVSERISLDGALPANMLSVLKPWAAMVILLRPDNTSGTFLDKHLGQIARGDGIPVLGLETVDEQLSAFDSITLDDQALLLESTLKDIDDKDNVYQQLLDAYIDGDMEAIVAISDASQPEDKRLAGLFEENLIKRRNRDMFARMQPQLRLGNTFVAVGALHLPGEHGLLSMLRQQGYTLTRLENGM